MNSKRGQMEMSFGMIFTIILIIAFLAMAFYGIQKFLEMRDEIQVKQFYESLEADIEDMWASQYGSKEVTYKLPNKAERICFEHPDILKLFYDNSIEERKLKNINLDIDSEDGDPFCIDIEKNEISFILENEDDNDPHVRIRQI
jgi:hypothetical protein